MNCIFGLMLFAALSASHAGTVRAVEAPAPAGAPAKNVTERAMHWFTEMQAGRTDRSLYAPAYGAQLTDEAVRGMSEALNKYGAAPLRAEIVQTRKIDEQTFYEVKFVFPRGDASSFLFGFDARGKITGISITSLAGE